ncbi:DUF3488 and transglutaminase-like domain-containing protein [uncultured Microbacterium sp.]|uniref:Transglutaminase domain-containing protein n=1 Tax=uncultured Microbacterium sp. TaxID=191216 RepID=A0A1Y5PG50_9MICO|nr:DUF3488 and transglutaminase-like domain-containing protein [uncultured Microbacterium sp.]SBS74888.1 Transglutaminase domain-containing protein [uncultured Microbacterium sp.]
MSAFERLPEAVARPRGERRLTLALYIALVSALAPLLSVVAAGAWTFAVASLTAALLALGFVTRRLRVPAVAVTLLETAVWAGAVTVMFFTDTALFAVIPTPESFGQIPVLIQTASNEILLGVAPLEPTRSVSFIIVAAMGILTIALDHVVLTARMPLLATIALVAVWLIPAIAVPSGVNVLAFAVLATAVLYLIRAETRTRETVAPRGRSDGAGVTAVAATIGAVAIIGAIIAAPALPPPVVRAGGNGFAATIDPTLELGDDLRQRGDVTALRVRTNAPALPYLRATTLSSFDGAVWRPDRLRSVPLGESTFDDVRADEDIRVTEYRTNVTIDQLSSAYLPVAFPAVAVDGLEGIWRAVPYSRTVQTPQSNTLGQRYEIVTHVPRPTLEQIRGAEARLVGSNIVLDAAPDGIPEIIEATAREVTAEATNDFDRLSALQSWFRGRDFSYSLLSPVQDGFDGTGADAIAQFLQVREGYCIHFAAAFALMARTLEMPSRIVVGFLPGSLTNEREEDQRIAEVKTSQLHAWPEVYFEGIGWIAFEPTKSLGDVPRFLPAAIAGVDDDGEDVAGPRPTTTPTASPAATPLNPEFNDGASSGAGSVQLVDLRPYLATIAVVLVLSVTPTALRALRLRMLSRRARAGDITAAWRIVQDVAIDLGAAVPASESPRAFGMRLMESHGAPPGEMRRLVNAVEHASYARAGAVEVAERAAEDAEKIRVAMLDAAPAASRAKARALMLPRSLIIRPGSAFADRVAPVA